MNVPITSIAWGMIQVTLLCGVILGFAWIVGGRRPQIISAMLGGCLACLTLGAMIWLPQSQWSAIPKSKSVGDAIVVQAPSTTAILDSSKPILEVTGQPSQANEANSGSTLESFSGRRLSLWLLSHVQGLDRNVRSMEVAERLQPSSVFTNALIVFTLGSISMCALWLHGWLYMRRILRRSQPLELQVMTDYVAEYAANLNLRVMPQVRVSDLVPIGAMVGCFRNVLILHPSWPQWTKDELRAVLFHELAHAARRDFLWVVISSWVRILFFFHPLVQLVVRRLRLEQELAADQLAAGFMENANAYGRALASLALRSQSCTRAPSPMLSAEQICIVRRITMLKHGCLAPRRRLLRWAGLVTLATTLLSLPLSGLRGTPPDETLAAKDENVKTAARSEEDVQAIEKEKQEAGKKLAKAQLAREVAKKYPPLRFNGSMIWNPGRFQSPNVATGIRWSHLAYTAMALGDLPRSGEVYGNSELQVSWSDLNREHGQFTLGASVKQADQIMPDILSRFFDLPEFGPHKLSQNTQVIEGRVASEVVIVDQDSSGSVAQRKIDSWVIDDEQGFVHGSEKEVAEIVRGEVDPFASIPQAFLTEYKGSAFATVFDCKEWEQQVRDFSVGSPEQAKVAMIAPLLKGLTSLGVFVQGREKGDFRIRVAYGDEQSATEAKTMIDGLLLLARGALSQSKPNSGKDVAELKIYSDLLKSVQVTLAQAEIQIEFDAPEAFVLTEADCNIPGWLAIVEDRVKLSEEKNTVRVDGHPYGCLGGFLAQSIDAKAYIGKRVRMIADLGTDPDASDRAGVFLWSSGRNAQSLTFSSRSIDGKSNMPSQLTTIKRPEYLSDAEVKWSTASIEVNVPMGSEILSLGAYTKNADLRVRNVRFEVIGNEDVSAAVEKPWLPYNLFVVPGHEFPSAPRNLNFSEQIETKSTEAEQVAEKPESDAIRR